MKPPLKFHGLRFSRSLSDAFPDVRAGCIEIHTRPSLMRRIVRAIVRWL